jgi:hypothetical protein
MHDVNMSVQRAKYPCRGGGCLQARVYYMGVGGKGEVYVYVCMCVMWLCSG